MDDEQEVGDQHAEDLKHCARMVAIPSNYMYTYTLHNAVSNGIIPERPFPKEPLPKRARVDQSRNLMGCMGIYDWFENGRFGIGRFGNGPSGNVFLG